MKLLPRPVPEKFKLAVGEVRQVAQAVGAEECSGGDTGIGVLVVAGVTPALNVCLPLVQDKSSLIWTWPTFLPFGNAPAPTVAKPPPLAPPSEMAIASGISAWFWLNSCTPNRAVYHNNEAVTRVHQGRA